MARLIVLVSGAVGSGKTTLATQLVERFGLKSLRTRDLITVRFPKAATSRAAMQRAGDRLDRETEGKWVMDGLVSLAETLPDNAAIIVDSVRIPNQIAAIRQAFGPRVKHIHLMADDETLAARHSQRRERTGEAGDYSAVRRNLTERNVEKLAKTADMVINTKRSTAPDVLVRAAAQLGFYGREYERLVDVVIGGQYGSEGKGNIVAYLAPEYDVLVRVGGPNAGHKVFEEPVPFTHLMLPSGTRRNENASLVIGPGAVLRVPLLLKEIADCAVDEGRLSIDPQAMIISDEDISAEKELMGAIGSTGQGVGAATARKITGRSRQTLLAKDVPDLAPFVRETYVVLEDAFRLGNRVLLEGTQGTGLSIHHGDYPHVTSRDTTVGGCLGEAGISPSRVRRTVMVCRTYPIRVQSPKDATSGPMTSELTLEEIAARSSIPLEELQKTELSSRTQKPRRIAEFDWVLLRRASYLNGPTDIALTFADYLSVENRSARRFEQLTPPSLEFIGEVERVALAPVSLISTRFSWRGIIDRRAW